MTHSPQSPIELASAQLSEREKALIHHQEVFRLAVQEKLSGQKEKSRAAAIWGVLNNSFTIFLFSSVLLPATAWWYASQDASAKADAAREQAVRSRATRIERLDNEIAYRISRTIAQLEAAERSLKSTQPEAINEALMILDAKLSNRNLQALSPPFANQSALSLMSEVRSELIAAGARAEQMSPTIEGTVSRAIKRLSVFMIVEHDEKTPKEVAGLLLEITSATKLDSGGRRWNKEFPYMDCSPSSPFC